MKTNKIIIIVSSVLLAGAGVGTFLYFRNKNKSESEKSDKETKEELEKLRKELESLGGSLGEPDESEYSAKDKISGSSNLKIGAKGRRVAMLQAILNYYEGESLKIDGAFGDKTRWALIKNGFPTCSVAKYCEVTDKEFTEMLKQTKGDKNFFKKYNYKTNPDIKSVWGKYSS